MSAPTRPATRRAPPSAVLGIVGGGQLAKMTAQAATRLGLEVAVLERASEFPANALDTRSSVGDWNDAATLIEFARGVDVVTLENEFVDAGALRALEAAGHSLYPTAAMIELVQDKLRQKEVLRAAGLPVADFRRVESPAEVEAAAQDFGWPMVLKKRRNAYDGKGNATVRSHADVERAWAELRGGPGAFYVERFVPFERELAVMVARGRDGASVSYPTVETVNRDHICRTVLAPAAVDARAAAEAERIARAAATAVGATGAFGVELFLLAGGSLLINELAPRVHNTGHYTIEACDSSQFDNHVRAVMGWPLGSPRLHVPAACMVNLIAVGPGSGEPLGLRDALAVPGAHVHVYGKLSSSRGRKMGHVTALGATLDEARAIAERAANAIHFGDQAANPR
jgi:5-(carboxyamino)imidazole ribonucleotide synthase